MEERQRLGEHREGAWGEGGRGVIREEEVFGFPVTDYPLFLGSRTPECGESHWSGCGKHRNPGLSDQPLLRLLGGHELIENKVM